MGLFRISAKNYAIGSLVSIRNGKFIIIRKNRLFKRLERPFRNSYFDEWKDVKSKSIFNVYDTSGKISAMDLNLLSDVNVNLKYINVFKEKKIAKEINNCNYIDNNPNNKKEDIEKSTEKAYQYIKKLR